MSADSLVRKAKAYGIQLTPEAAAALVLYAKCLMHWNQKINLTAITKPEEVEDKHFIDCMVLAQQKELRGNLVDVGSGAGFPGAVAALLRPDIKVWLMEANGKKVAFLEALRQELLPTMPFEVHFLNMRAEAAARVEYREYFDTATARAVAALPELCEYCLPLLKTGGFFIAMKADVAEELPAAHNAIQVLGGALHEVREYVLPDGAKRSLVIVQKITKSSEKYPRATAAIKKRPL